MKKTLLINGKTINLYLTDNLAKAMPIVYLNLYQGDGHEIWEQCMELPDCPDFTLAAIGDIDWDHEMTPWETAPIFPGDTTYAGRADSYLELLQNTIIPEIVSTLSTQLSIQPLYHALAGYSLGGLFTAYAAYRTDFFTRFASMSGSLWYPGFSKYAQIHTLAGVPDCFYLSLGAAESHTRNKVLAEVEKNTRQFSEHLSELNIPTILEINPGNHYRDAALRTAKGIHWMLSCPQKS